jgi:translation initiation factor IF-2
VGVILLGKVKLHEIAKKIGVNSKEVVEKAMELGLDVKSHMSTVEEDDAKKIESKFSGVKKEVKEKKEEPVIIRRAVIVSEDENEKLKEEKKIERKNNRDVGFIERERKTDYNIVYRNKPNKPMTVSELFGKKTTPEKPKTEVKSEVKPEVKPQQPVETIQEKPAVVQEKTGEQSDKRNNNFAPQSRQYNNGSRPFNREGYNNNRPYNNTNRSFDRDSQNNTNRPFNRNGQNNRPFNKEGYNNNKPFNRNGQGQSGFGRRPLDEKGIEKNIKNIMSADIVEKESVREYANKAIDKQKNNRYEEKTNKKSSKSRKGGYEEISSHKLKDLKQQDRLSNMFDEGSMLDYYDLTTTRGRRSKKKLAQSEDRVKQKIFDLTDITIPESITVKDLSAELKKTSSEIIKKLLGYGIMATINNEVDFDTAFLIAEEFGVTAHKKEVVTDEDILFDDSEDKEEDLKARPPVIVVMGHVDHGKTSLLDAVRETNVIEGEAGGITQAIGAYQVEINGREITFLDTPGHEAFTAMRARGAQITDIAILVVAANDGVMPQTVEAINHAKAAGIPIIVAINKIDVEGANPDKVKQELAEYELVSEEWGGDTIFVPISAKKRINIDNLLEMVLLVADMKELKANPKKQAKGTVIEAKLDKAKGPVATMLVQRGTLDVGDTILVGSVIGRIRTMTDDKGHKVKKAGPSTPVEITGLTSVPEAGETFYEVKDEKTAKHLMETRKRKAREKALNASSKVTLDDLFSQIEKGNLKQLNIIVKADVQGSVEAVKQSLEKLSNDEVKVKVIHANVGAVTESDVTLANVSNAIIIGFNVRPEPIAKDMAEKSEVEIKTYSVIYNAIEDVQAAMKGMLDPVFKEVVIGNAEVRQTFKISDVGTIAGCYVTNGKVARNAGVRVLRDNVVIHDGKLISLKRMKDDAKEVASGYECGIQIENFNDIKEGDIIEAFIMEQVKQ